jgi:hypothetical protein
MPWPSFSVLTEGDAKAIVAYLRSLPPVKFAVPRNAKVGERPPAPYQTIVQPK